ncbi:MAG TPA: FmdB family zinc ribbon protein [Acidimicrobiales bacterium]|nr:FmdB family zinc ribbon protein [Acidimicrobiales bacterium]
MAVPTYEYRCKECGEELEVVQAFTDDALTTCPSCGAEALRKIFGAVGISFKGSGFYKTDSRGTSSTTSTGSSSSSSSSESSGSTSTGSDGGSSSSSPAPASTTSASST